MLRHSLVPCVLLFASALHAQSLKPADLRCDYLVDPVGVTNTPQLSWSLQAVNPDEKNVKQTAFQIRIATSAKELTSVMADGPKVESDEQRFSTQLSNTEAAAVSFNWQVRVWDQNGKPSEWSSPARFVVAPDLEAVSTALRAEWISGISGKDTLWLRKDFELKEVPPLAAVHAASFGYHEVYVNGKKADDTVLNPASSNLMVRVMSRSYDITKLLKPGKNTVGLWIGHGWSCYGTWKDIRKDGDVEGGQRIPHGAAVKAVIDLGNLGSGSFATNTTWKSAPSSYQQLGNWGLFNFGGEYYDANKANPDWSSPNFDASAWAAATIVKADEGVKITPQLVEPNRIVSTFNAVKAEKKGDKKFRIDMSKVYSGWLKIPLTGKKGDVVTLKYSDRDVDDAHNKEDSCYGQEDKIMLSGKPELDVFESKFNYRTYRFVVVEGVEELPPLDKIVGELIRTDYAAGTTFESSNEMFNKIHKTILHTYECLTLGGYIVDCAHRERLGYGAEGQASMECGMFNFDQAALYRHWAGSWRDVLMKDGQLPNTAPQTWGGGGPAWKIVCATLPWEHYVNYGDKRVLEENYEMIQRHLAYLEDLVAKDSKKILPVYRFNTYNYIGDWYSSFGIDPPQDGRPIPRKLRQFFSNCFVIYGYQTAAKIAEVLGKNDDVAKYQKLATDLQAATHKEFYNAEKEEYADFKEQTYLSTPLYVGVVPQNLTETIQKALVDNIKVKQKGHLTTGVLGSYIQLKYLTKIGRGDLVAESLKNTDEPSYGFFLSKGLTTVPEAPNIIGSGSRCHTSFLSGGAWFINTLAGIQPDPKQPGFKHFFVRPEGVDSVDWVKATHQTPFGKIAVAWKNDKETRKFTLNLTVPPNTSATVILPSGETKEVGSGTYEF